MTQHKILVRLLLALFIILALLPQIYLHSFKTDDAYITFRYATRFAGGQGLTFNPGEHVEGYSNPSWTLLIAGLVWISHIDAPTISFVLGLLFSLGTLAVIWKLFCSNPSSPYYGISNFIICTVTILFNPGFHVFATAGLEGPLFMFLITTGIILSLGTPKKPIILATIMFSLVAITRPEGLLYAILWYFFSIILRGKNCIDIRLKLVLIPLLFLPFTIYEGFRFLYFGAWLPNTFFAKPVGTTSIGPLAIIAYLLLWLISLVPFFLLAVVRVKHGKEFLELLRVSTGPVIACLIFVVYTQSDWMPFGRFIVPIWPSVAIVLAFWVQPIVNFFNVHIRQRSFKPVIPILIIAIVLSSWFAWKNQILAYINNKGMNMLMRGTDQLRVGEWLSENVERGTTVATIRLGGISYAAPDLIFWDLNGLTDREEALYISQKRPGGFNNDPIWKRSPQIIAAVAVPAAWSYTEDIELLRWMEEQYTFVRSFPQGNYGSFDIWVRNDLLDALGCASWNNFVY